MENFICELCGESCSEDTVEYFEGKALCHSCYESETTICEHCGDRIWFDDVAPNNLNRTLCQQCFDTDYTECSECGLLLSADEANYLDHDEYNDHPLCGGCYDDLYVDSSYDHETVIQSYSYKPSPIFYGDENRFFGVELEIDVGGECDDNALELLDLANGREERLYCKHDSSLEHGFELVTHPMSLEYHKNSMPWLAILNKAVRMGYYSHMTSTCGLHVHVNRDCFGISSEEQETCIARILFFVENHWNELIRFSRRTKKQLEQWAARYGRKDSPKEVLDTAKNISIGRYAGVNITNCDTIEFRIFRGTLKYNMLIAVLQLVNEICSTAILLSDEELADLSWSEFVSRLNQKEVPELIKYLKERNLYINEAVNEESEEY